MLSYLVLVSLCTVIGSASPSGIKPENKACKPDTTIYEPDTTITHIETYYEHVTCTSCVGSSSSSAPAPLLQVPSTTSAPALYSIPAAAPAVTLVPTVHWDNDPTSLAHLVPCEIGSTYYTPDGTSDPTQPHQFSWTNTTFNSPAVILDHSTYITYTYSLGSNSFSIVFSDVGAFSTAQGNWTSSTGLILVAYNASCGTTAADSCYFKVTDLTFESDGLSCTASGNVVSLKDVMSSVSAQWGRYKPIGVSGTLDFGAAAVSVLSSIMSKYISSTTTGYGLPQSGKWPSTWPAVPTTTSTGYGNTGLSSTHTSSDIYSYPGSFYTTSSLQGGNLGGSLQTYPFSSEFFASSQSYFSPHSSIYASSSGDGFYQISGSSSFSSGFPYSQLNSESTSLTSGGLHFVDTSSTSSAIGPTSTINPGDGHFPTNSLYSPGSSFTAFFPTSTATPSTQLGYGYPSSSASFGGGDYESSSSINSNSGPLITGGSPSEFSNVLPTSTITPPITRPPSTTTATASLSPADISSLSSSLSSIIASLAGTSSSAYSYNLSTPFFPNTTGIANSTIVSNFTTSLNSSASTNTTLFNSPSGCVLTYDPIYGLPQTCLGPDFDLDLDTLYGYLSLDETNFSALLNIFPGLLTDSSLRKRNLGKRCEWYDLVCDAEDAYSVISSVATEIASTVSSDINVVTSAIESAATAVASSIVQAAEAVGQDISEAAADVIADIEDGLNSLLNYRVDLSIPISVGAPSDALVDSPWGNQVLIASFASGSGDQGETSEGATSEGATSEGETSAGETSTGETSTGETSTDETTSGEKKKRSPSESEGSSSESEGSSTASEGSTTASEGSSTNETANDNGDGAQFALNIFCVDCGVTGSIDLYGQIAFNLSGITDLEVGVDADLSMGVEIGIDAKATYQKTFSSTLFKQGIPELCTGTVYCVGPYVSVGTALTLTAQAEGQLLVGGTYGVTNATAALVIYGGSSYAENWTPQFTPVFEANGQIELSVTFSLPVSLGVGISALEGEISEDVSLTATPSLTASASFDAEVSLDANGTLTEGVGQSDGCDGIAISLDYEQTISYEILGDLGNNLYDSGAIPIAGTCIALGSFQAEGTDTATPDTPTGLGSGSGNLTSSYITVPMISTADANNSIVHCADGDVYMISAALEATANLTSCSNSWTAFTSLYSTQQQATVNSSVVADSSRRIPVMFPNVIGKASVSRLRLVDSTKIPAGAEYVAFNPSPLNDGSIVPLDQYGNSYSVVVCSSLDGSYSTGERLLLVPTSSAAAGLANLNAQQLGYSVAGSADVSCSAISIGIDLS